MDLSRKAFAQIAELKTGVVAVTSRVVSCSGGNEDRAASVVKPSNRPRPRPNSSSSSKKVSTSTRTPRTRSQVSLKTKTISTATAPSTLVAEPHLNLQQPQQSSTQSDVQATASPATHVDSIAPKAEAANIPTSTVQPVFGWYFDTERQTIGQCRQRREL